MFRKLEPLSWSREADKGEMNTEATGKTSCQQDKRFFYD